MTTVARGLEVPWEIAFLPDRRALITERPGRVRLLQPRRAPVRQRRWPRWRSAADGEGGLLGLAVDPQFARNRFVYLYRTRGERNEVLRYRLDGTRLREQATIVDDIPAASIHDGGRIHFGADGRLYVSTGEAGDGPTWPRTAARWAASSCACRPTAYRGARAVRPQVFSLGHRNPQGFDWEPGTGRLVATEHGPSGGDGPRASTRSTSSARAPTTAGRRSSATSRGTGLVAPAAVYEDAIAPVGRLVRVAARLGVDRRLHLRGAGGRADAPRAPGGRAA